jgi:predicted amidophosphoribosyltransferase
MKEYFGWTQSSGMAATYVHLSGRDVDNALLKLHGLTKDENGQESVLKIRVCERCKEKNDAVSQFCRRCGSPLELKVALDLETKKKEKDELVATVIERLSEKLNIEKAVQEVIQDLKVEEKFKKI